MSRTSTENVMNAFREIESGSGESPLVSRETRLPRFLGARADANDVLSRLGVAVLGVGAVGRPIALHLARLMIDRIWVVDPGRIGPENLLTQPVFPDDLEQPKASNVAALCKSVSPQTKVFAFDGPIQALETTAIAEADLAVLATDNLLAEVHVGQRCLYLQQPLIQASVHGDTLTAQIRVFGNQDPEGPCPACGFGENEWSHLNRQTTFSCDGAPGERSIARTPSPPTMSVSFLCTLAADLALLEILRFTVGLGTPVDNSMLEYCGYNNRTVTSPLRRRPDCPADHAPWDLGQAPRPLAECSLRELIAAAGLEDRDGALWQLAVTVDEMCYVERGICRRWHERPIERFVPAAGPAGRCPACGDPLSVEPFYAYRPASGERLKPVLDRPLCEISAAMPRWVVVRRGDHAVLFRSSADRAAQDAGVQLQERQQQRERWQAR